MIREDKDSENLMKDCDTDNILGRAGDKLNKVMSIGFVGANKEKEVRQALRLDGHFMESTNRRTKYLNNVLEGRKNDKKVVDEIMNRFDTIK